MKDPYLEYFEILRLLTVLENLFTTSAVPNSVLIYSPFSDKFDLSRHDLIRQ